MAAFAIDARSGGGLRTFKQALLVSAFSVIALPSVAHAQATTVTAGTPRTSVLNMDADDTLDVQAGATFQVNGASAANINGNTINAGIIINNSGLLEARNNDNARAINSAGDFTARNVTINNFTGALMQGGNDGIRFSTTSASFDALGSVITINNQGTIRSRGVNNAGARITSQGIEVGALGTASLVVNNSGLIEGPQGILSLVNTTIVNSGTIQGLQDAASLTTGEAIRLDGSGTNVVTLRSGSTTAAGTGASATANAVNFTGMGSNTLNMETGAIVIGKLKANTGTNDVINLSGTGSALIPTLVDFDVLNVNGGTWDTQAAITVSGGANIAAGATLSLSDSGAIGGGAVRGSIVNNGTLVFARTGVLSQTFVPASGPALVSPISGSGMVRVINGGTAVFTAANTYSGLTSIENGKIRTDADNTLSALSRVFVDTAGILELNDGTTDAGGALTPVARSQVIGNLSGSGAVRLGSLNAATLTIGSVGGDSTFSGAIQQTGNIVKNGTATLTLTGVNTYSGTTAVNAGTLALSGTGSVAGTSALALASGATFDIAGADGARTIKQLSGAAGSTVTLGANQLSATYASDATFAGVIGGSGNFAKAGTGTLTLSGANGLTGSLDVTEGRLILTGSTAGSASLAGGTTLDGAGSIGGTLSVADGATLNIGNGGVGTLTLGGLVLNPTSILNYDLAAPDTIGASDRIQVNGNLVLDGRLNAANAGGFGAGVYRLIDVTGSITNNGLSIASLPAGYLTAQGTIQVQSGQVNLVISNDLPSIQFWDGAGSADDGIVAGGNGSWTNSLTNWTTPDGSNNSAWQGAFAVFQGAAGTVTIDDPVLFTGMQFMTTGYDIASGSGALTTNAAEASLRVDPGVAASISAAIGGAGGLSKRDAGTLTLSGANTYAGVTLVEGGTLVTLNGAAIPDASAVTVAAGATLDVAQSETIGALSGAGAIALTGTLTTNTAANSTFSGTTSGTGGLTKAGSGTLTLNGTGGHTGLTTVTGGRLLLLAAGGLPSTGSVQVDGGAIFELGVSKTLGSIAGSGTIELGANRLTVGSGTFAGVISGAGGGLTKNGTGVLTLSGANTYTGTTNITDGTLAISGAGSIASSTGLNLSGAASVFDISGATGTQSVTRLQSTQTTAQILLGANTLDIVNDGTALTYSGTISGTGAIRKSGTGQISLASTNTYSGGTTVAAGTLRAQAVDAFGSGVLTVNAGGIANLAGFATHVAGVEGAGSITLGAGGGLYLTGSGSQTFAGVISGSSPVTRSGTGTQTLTGANTYTGATVISGGTLALAGAGSIATSSSVSLTGAGAQFDVSGATAPVAVNQLSSLAGSTIALGATNLTATNATTAEIAGVISGSGNFTKDGAGTLILSGVNTLTGAVNVNAGMLDLTGSTAGGVNLVAGTTLTGNGTIAGTLNVGAGTLEPGQGGVGTLTVGQLVLGSSSVLNFDLGAPGVAGASDRIQVNGNLTLNGTLNGRDAGGFGTGVYRVIDYTGTLSGSGLVIGTLPSGFSSGQAEVQTSVAGQVNLVIAEAIPAIQFWDGSNVTANGTIDGGSGSWNLSARNWVDLNGNNNNVWGGRFAVFTGQAGTVTVDQNVAVTGIQFMTDGYVIANGAGSIAVTDPATNLRVDPNVNATIAESLTGAGGIVKNDLGTLILSGTNTYGGATQVAFGTLRVTGGSAIPVTSAVTVNSGATLDVAASQTIGSLAGAGIVSLSGGSLTAGGTNASTTFSGTISGSGGLTKTGTGTLTLSGTSSYTGPTAVQGGVLAGKIGSGDLTVAAGATFDQAGTTNAVATLSGAGSVVLGATSFSAGAAASSTFSGVMSGTGNFTKTGTGNLTLSGANTYAGTTTIAGGTLTLANSTALLDTARVTVGNTATLALGASKTIATLDGAGTVALGANTLSVGSGTYGGIIGGTGGLTKTGAGILTLTGASTYTGATNVSGGTLALTGSGSIAAASLLNLTGGATFDMSGTGAQTVLGLTGAAGTRVLLGANTLTVNQASGTQTFAGVISGSGGLTKAGAGTLVLSGDNTYTGPTRIEGGVLRAGVASAFGEGSLFIGDTARADLAGFSQTVASLSGGGTITLGAGTLTVGDATSTTYAGVISGTGALNKVGTGTLTLTGASTYTGATSVLAGGLVVNGSVTSAVQVAEGARLGGTGRTGGLTVLGTVAPGNSIGTLNVSGPLTFGANSTLQVEIAPDGTSDLIAATGGVTINGGTVSVLGTGGTNYANLTEYTIVTGSSVTGQFNSVIDNLAFLDPTLVYTTTAVKLLMQRNDISFASVGATPNQVAVGGALDALGGGTLYNAVINYSPDQARSAFAALSGEVHAASFANTVRNATNDRRPVVERLAADSGEGLQLWADGALVDRTVDGQGGYYGFSSTRYSVASGFEYGLDTRSKLGVSFGYANDRFAMPNLSGLARTRTTSVFAYGSVGMGGFALRAGAGKSWLSVKGDRDVIAPTFVNRLNWQRDGQMWQAFGELAYRVKLGGLDVEPFVGAAHVNASLEAGREAGGTAALGLGAVSFDTDMATAGLRLDGKLLNFGKTGLNLDAEIAGDHYFSDKRPLLDMTLAGSTQSFRIGAAGLGQDVVRVRLGLTTDIAGGDFGVAFVGSYSEGQQESGVRARIRWNF